MTYAKLYEQFVKLSQRERLLILIAGSLAIMISCYTFVIEDLVFKQTEAESAITSISQETAIVNGDIERLKAQLSVDPDVKLKQQKQQLQKLLTAISGDLDKQTRDLIPPNKMVSVLQRILATSDGIKVQSFEALPAKRMVEQNDNKNAQETLYQHGLSMVLEGDFFSLRRYLNQLEILPWRFYWDSFDYIVIDYPTASLRIELYTLSTSQAFIGV